MDPTLEEMIKAVRDHAQAHYSDKDRGWDYIVETYTDEELTELIRGCSTTRGAINRASHTCRIMAERRADVQATAF